MNDSERMPKQFLSKLGFTRRQTEKTIIFGGIIMAKKLIAVIMALALVLSFAACGGKDDSTTTTAPETTVDPFESFGDETTVPEAESTEAVSASDDESTSVVDASAVSETEEQSTEASAAPKTKEEVVAYFNTAINGVKKGAKSVTHHYSKISLNGATKLPGWANTVMKVLGGADKFIDDQLTKNSKGEETLTGSEAIKAAFPVEGESWSSKLTAADVKDFAIKESDGKYMIRLTTVADGKSSTVKHGGGHAPKAFNVVLPGVVNDNVPSVAANLIGGTAEMNYPSSTVTVTVDIATGRVLKADYDLKWTINFGTDTIIPFTTLDSYTINW